MKSTRRRVRFQDQSVETQTAQYDLIRNIPEVILRIPMSFEAYSLIKGHWAPREAWGYNVDSWFQSDERQYCSLGTEVWRLGSVVYLEVN